MMYLKNSGVMKMPSEMSRLQEDGLFWIVRPML